MFHNEVKEDVRPRTRCGYLVPEAFHCYEQSLGEVGALASGKLLHYAADLICSGGLDIWIRGAYSYAIQHIGIANPRIFVYLRQRISELDKKAALLPHENFYNNPDVQSNIAEVVLVLQLCPRRTKVSWPKVDPTTKRAGWLQGVASAPETRATRTVWSVNGDSRPLYLISNELCKAIEDGSSERALFWVRWTLDEDARIRKETKGHGLSTKERGPKGSDAGHFIAAVLNEIYKELASANQVRMHEEFAELQRLWKSGEVRMAASLRKECLGLLVLICCDVPKWKTPAAPTLVADPVRLSRAVSQATGFFNEVLSNKPLTQQLNPKMMKARATVKKTSEKEKKDLTIEEQFGEYDAVMEAYLNRSR